MHRPPIRRRPVLRLCRDRKGHRISGKQNYARSRNGQQLSLLVSPQPCREGRNGSPLSTDGQSAAPSSNVLLLRFRQESMHSALRFRARESRGSDWRSSYRDRKAVRRAPATHDGSRERFRRLTSFVRRKQNDYRHLVLQNGR